MHTYISCIHIYICRFMHTCLHTYQSLHDQHVYYKWHVFVISFIPAQSLLWVYSMWVNSYSSLEVFQYFSSSFMSRRLALNRELLTLGADIDVCIMAIHLWDLNPWDLHHCNPSEHTCGRHMCILVIIQEPCQECTEWLFPPLL